MTTAKALSAGDATTFQSQLAAFLNEGWLVLSSGRERDIWWALLVTPPAPVAEVIPEPSRAVSTATPAPAPSQAAPAPAEALMNARGGAADITRHALVSILYDYFSDHDLDIRRNKIIQTYEDEANQLAEHLVSKGVR